MGKHKNVIEINGQIYDAVSGKPVSAMASPQTASVDGVIAPKRHQPVKPVHKNVVSHKQVSASSNAPKAHSTKRAKSAVHHNKRTAQTSQTLMRKSVKRPDLSQPEQAEIKPGHHMSPAMGRATRAQTIPKSAFVSKFGSAQRHTVTKRVQELAVKEQVSADIQKQPTVSLPSKTKSGAITDERTNRDDIFSAAIANATSSPAPKHKRHHAHKSKHSRKAKHLSWGSGIAAAVLLVGFIAYMSLPALSVQIASKRAGFGAVVPGYQPSGYSLDREVDSKPGQVTLSFSSNTDDRNFTLTQAVSSWNSTTLQENFLTANNKTYQATQENGKTIYIYDSGNATWVNGGVWYQIDGNSVLSSDQLLKIAASL